MAPSLPIVRPILRALSHAGSKRPFETVVIVFCLTTYSYFILLQAVKHSSFLSPTSPYSDLKPSYVVNTDGGEWQPASKELWSAPQSNAWSKVELQQIVVGLDTLNPYARASARSAPVPAAFYDLTTPPIQAALANFTSYLTSANGSSTGSSYPTICYPSPSDPFACLASIDLPTTPTRSATFTLAFRPPPSNRERWSSAMAGRHFTSGNDVKFVIGRREDRIDQIEDNTWIAYACRALVMRFWDLARNADSADIFVVLIGYILMHGVFVNLFYKGRSLGSNFWLAGTTLISSVFSFVLAVPVSLFIGIPFDPVGLSEALPFLVITVGFDKPLQLARKVFSHPGLYAHSHASSLKGSSAKSARLTFKPASDVVCDAVEQAGEAIVRDYAIEVAVLAVGAVSGVGGLKEFCALAALILIADCIMLFTFYVALLNVFVEVRRVQLIRKTTKRRSPTDPSPSPPETPSVQERGTETWFGTKHAKGDTIDPKRNPAKQLKLILLASFLALHILNLCTTLTPAVALNRFMDYPSQNAENVPRYVDATTPSLTPLLATLAASHSTSTAQPIIVRVASPIYIRVVPPAHLKTTAPYHSLPAGSIAATPYASETAEHVDVAMIEAFMSQWSNVVGDPIVSKWIVLALAVSIFLNGYLLKGIGASTTPIQQAVQFAPDSAAPSVPSSPKITKKKALFGARTEDAPSSSESEKVADATDVQGLTKDRIFSGTHVDILKARRLNSDTWGSGGNTPLNLGAMTPGAMTPGGVESPLPRSESPAPAAPGEVFGRSLGLSNTEGPTVPIVVAPKPTNSPPAIVSPVPEKPSSGLKTTIDMGMMTPLGTPRGTVASVGRRSLEECLTVFENEGVSALNDEEVILLSQNGKIAQYALEKILGDHARAVKVRRALISRASATKTLEASAIPMDNYDYSVVFGACCENVVGFMPLPLGIAGPLNIDGESFPIPMATAEGTLVASTSRGCKALNAGGGVTTVLTQDAMTRGPAIEFPSIVQAAQAKLWVDSAKGSQTLKDAFDSTSKYARLMGLKCGLAGRTLYVRFAASTGDAMGMNMISKGTEKALGVMAEHFPQMQVLALSGNYCTDKKPNAMNWIEGRGKSVVAEAVVPGKIVKSVLKTTVKDLCNLNTKKNLIGSGMAGSIGGFNAHAANILTAMFLATGQDPAQNVVSSNCMTLMEPTNDGEDLLITVSMPSIEVGTVGGGTILPPQKAVLQMLGLQGAHPTSPGHNSRRLARVIAAAVMAGELSLMSALAAGHLIKAHMAHNRSQPATPLPTRPGTPSALAPAKEHAAAEAAVARAHEKREAASEATTKS